MWTPTHACLGITAVFQVLRPHASRIGDVLHLYLTGQLRQWEDKTEGETVNNTPLLGDECQAAETRSIIGFKLKRCEQ